MGGGLICKTSIVPFLNFGCRSIPRSLLSLNEFEEECFFYLRARLRVIRKLVQPTGQVECDLWRN